MSGGFVAFPLAQIRIPHPPRALQAPTRRSAHSPQSSASAWLLPRAPHFLWHGGSPDDSTLRLLTKRCLFGNFARKRGVAL
jgi:hypothetical protein